MRTEIIIPENVNRIIRELNTAGYKACAVGGCIRDSLMGKVPSDWDICTSALPEETLRVLNKPNIIENGLKHGTVTVRYDNVNYEITTFRTDGAYSDNRHPESVTFVTDLKEDLSRRDFTINALAYDPTDGLTDCFGGEQDIKNGIIRCVGDPDRRFNEDGLRIMRALRFSSVLGFAIEEKTAASVRKNAGLLRNISAERITSEFKKLIVGRDAERILTDYPDVLSVFIPEIKPMIGLEQKNPHHCYDVWTHTVKAVGFIQPEPLLRLTALLHDIGKPYCFTVDDSGVGHFKGHPEVSEKMSNDILRRMKYDNNTIDSVKMLVRLHDKRPPAEPKYVRRFLSETGPDMFLPLMALKRADALAQSSFKREEKLLYTEKLTELYYSELKAKTAYSPKTLELKGGDLISLGITEGKRIGSILKAVLEKVMDGDLENNKESLIGYVRSEYLKETE